MAILAPQALLKCCFRAMPAVNYCHLSAMENRIYSRINGACGFEIDIDWEMAAETGRDFKT
jgi:hypothetical protein